MAGRVDGKVAVVTGGAMGIGEAAVRGLAAEGAQVVIVDIAVERGEELASEIGEAALFVRHDVTDGPRWPAVISATVRRFGGLDILINNAGLVSLGTAESVSDADWARHMALNLDAAVIGSRLGFEAMRTGSRQGSIINVASTSTVRGYSAHFAYVAAKGGIRGLTRSVAAYGISQRVPIRCNCIIPGGILTPMADVFAALTRDMPSDVQFASSAAAIDGDDPLDRAVLGAPSDIGNLAVYLGSGESRFVNGAEFVVDNGATRLPPRGRVV